MGILERNERDRKPLLGVRWGAWRNIVAAIGLAAVMGVVGFTAFTATSFLVSLGMGPTRQEEYVRKAVIRHRTVEVVTVHYTQFFGGTQQIIVGKDREGRLVRLQYPAAPQSGATDIYGRHTPIVVSGRRYKTSVAADGNVGLDPE